MTASTRAVVSLPCERTTTLTNRSEVHDISVVRPARLSRLPADSEATVERSLGLSRLGPITVSSVSGEQTDKTMPRTNITIRKCVISFTVACRENTEQAGAVGLTLRQAHASLGRLVVDTMNPARGARCRSRQVAEQPQHLR